MPDFAKYLPYIVPIRIEAFLIILIISNHFSLNTVKLLVSLMRLRCVHFEVGNEYLCTRYNTFSLFLPWRNRPLLGQGLIIIEDSWSHLVRHTHTHTHTHTHSVELLCTKDQPEAETSIWQHSQEKTAMPSAGFEPTIPTSERTQVHFLDRAATGTG